ncbi:MAG: lysylphosphatidylglycerol synthase domain-containing protein [Armatimonadota bacterium]|jgi:uncharacterized membrane protein YbhN (UPF0104 family)
MLKRIAAVLVVGGLLAWVIHRAWQDAGTIDWSALEIRPGMIGLSVVVVLVAWGWHGALWSVMIRGLGYDLGPLAAVRASLVGNLGNYIPGKVFIVIIRARLVRGAGVPGMVVASSVVLETLLRNLVAALMAAVGLWYLGAGGSYLSALAVLVVASVVVVHPAVFNRLTDYALRKLGRPPLPRHLRMRSLVTLLVGYAVYWSFYVLAFFLLTRGTLGAEMADLPGLSVALLISLIASMIAVFTPVGLGVADATLAGVLALTGAVGAPGVLAVIMRVWRTVTEVGIAGVGWLLPVGTHESLSETLDHADESIESGEL